MLKFFSNIIVKEGGHYLHRTVFRVKIIRKSVEIFLSIVYITSTVTIV